MAFPPTDAFTGKARRERAASPRALAPALGEARVRQILTTIEFQALHSVRELARQVRLTPAHVQRVFKRETGAHVGAVLAERRLQLAAQLLRDSDLPVKEIAYAVGYEHPSSFVRAFQRRFEQSPRRYRLQSDNVDR
jgi:AraC-like DNA-binding protein